MNEVKFSQEFWCGRREQGEYSDEEYIKMQSERIKELEIKLKGSEERNMILFNGKNKIIDVRDHRIKEFEGAMRNFCSEYDLGFLPLTSSKHHYEKFKKLLNTKH